MRLTIMRHGATEANLAHRYEGARTDSPLCEQGVQQCRRINGGLLPTDVRKVYTSTMLRARQTARLCFPLARVVQTPHLEEFDFGVFEGRTANQMENDNLYRMWVESGCVDPCPNGDTLYDYTARTAHTVAKLLLESTDRGEQDVVVVAHNGTIMATLWELAASQHRRQGPFDWHAPNCGGYQAEVRIANDSVELVNPRAFK